MNRIIQGAGWTLAIVMLAVLARVGWVDREAAHPLLIVMPSLAFAAIAGGTACRRAVRSA